MGCQITLATNGLLIDDNMIKFFRNHKKLKLQISLESSIEKEHDFYRGEGTFKNTIAIIKKLVKNNLAPVIRMTVSNINFNNIHNFVDLGKELKVYGVSINKYTSDTKHPSKLLSHITPIEHHIFLNTILELKKAYGDEFILTEDPCFNDINKKSIKKEFFDELAEDLIVGGCSADIKYYHKQ